ncbi:MAG: hypothetical protein ACI8QS_001732 [Planctomycetota bacterium]|jgi:hypothetical protein
MVFLFPSTVLLTLFAGSGDGEALVRVRELMGTIQGPQLVEVDHSEAVSEIEGLVPLCRPALFQAFVDNAFEEPGHVLEPAERELLLDVLAAPQAADLFVFLRTELDWSQFGPQRLAALEIVGAHGSADEMSLAVELAGWDEPPSKALRRRLRNVFERSLGQVLARDPRAFGQLERLWSRMPDEMLTSGLRAMGRSGSADAVDPLVTAMRSDERAAGVALAEIGRLAAELTVSQRKALVDQITPYARHEHPGVRAALTRALAELGRREALPVLVDLLADADSSVVTSSHRALVQVSGVQLRADASRWRSWLAAENRWFAEEAPGYLLQLESDSDAAVFDALRELSLRRLYRQDFSSRLIDLLEHDSAAVRAHVCDVLAACNIESALPRLAKVLRYDEEPVWRAAWTALKALTGQDHPSDPDQWDEIVLEYSGKDS